MDDTSNKNWNILGKKFPKSEVVFFVQVILIYIVVITSIANLSLNRDDSKLWIALLSSNIGYLLPNPNLSEKK